MKNGHGRMKSKNEALTYMASLPAESKLSSAKLSTSVTLRVSHSSMPKMAFGRKIKKIRLSQVFRYKILLDQVKLLMVINGKLYGH